MVVTIDGPGGVGKSTVAKLLAQELDLMYLDTGATYRALAYAVLERQLSPVTQPTPIAALARKLPLHLEPTPSGSLRVLLNGRNISKAIRTERITEAAAQVSQHPEVRRAMVKLQRVLADRHGVVVEGRDTGSVVFPSTSHKFFLDADPLIRARRRQQELKKLYGTEPPLTEIKEQLQLRDELDRTRSEGPLMKPRGAVVIDTSRRSARDVVRLMRRSIEQIRSSSHPLP